MDQIEGALARFSAARKEDEAAELEAAEDLFGRRTYTVERALGHTNVESLLGAMTDAAEVLERCLELPECAIPLRVRCSAMALRDWSRWMSVWANGGRFKET